MAAFGVGTMPALTAVAMGLRKVVMGNMAMRRLLAAGIVIAALWSIGKRSGLWGERHMHGGPGMQMESDTAGEMQHPPEHQHPGGE
jgi:hypothetical protein